MKICDRTDVHYAIRDVVAWADKVPGDKIHLNIGDPVKFDFDTPDFVKEAVIKAIREGKNYYDRSDGDPEILKAIAQRYKKTAGRAPDHSLVTQGVAESIEFLFSSLVEKGDNILLPSPVYPQYLAMCTVNNCEAREYHCIEENGWNPDPDDMRKKIDEHTRAIVIINPNNPTGAVYSKQFLQGVVDVAGEHDVPIISDEIYDMITFSDYTPMSSLAKDVKLVALNGISKNYLSPGWRIGHSSFYNCDELYEACLRLARIRLCANTPASYGLLAAYTSDNPHIESEKKKLLARRNLMMKRFDEMGLDCVMPNGAFYAFPKCPGDDREFVKGLLEKEKVLTVFGSGFGEQGAGHFRVVFLPDEATLTEACDRIERYVKSL